MENFKRKRERTVVFAPHDDGFGAFEACSRVARALTGEATNANCDLRLIFLNSKAAENGQDDLNKAVPNGKAVYVETDNLITLPKVDGEVDAVELLPILKRVREFGDMWPVDQKDNPVKVNWKEIDLAISMGVPWVHRHAQDAGKLSVEIGDMCFSIVVRGCLEEAQLPLLSEDKRTLKKIAEYEYMAKEAWLLPFMAPREYEDHFASADVPVNWMPGVLWTGDPIDEGFDPKGWSERNKMRQALEDDLSSHRNKETLKIVRVEAGKTPVWKKIFESLKKRENQDKDAPAIITVEKSVVKLLEQKQEQNGITLAKSTKEFQKLKDARSRASASRAMYAAVDLGITRGGGSALGFVAGRTPVALTEELFHWLSRRQREALIWAGLCLPIALREFRQNPDALIRSLLNDPRLEDVQKRMYGIRIGSERDLARYLFNRYLDT